MKIRKDQSYWLQIESKILKNECQAPEQPREARVLPGSQTRSEEKEVWGLVIAPQGGWKMLIIF